MAADPLSPICPIPRLTTAPVAQPTAAPAPGGSFGVLLNQLLSANTTANQRADQAVQALATGEAQDLHEVSLAVAQADLSLRTILQIRNRLTEAFQDITRMQV